MGEFQRAILTAQAIRTSTEAVVGDPATLVPVEFVQSLRRLDDAMGFQEANGRPEEDAYIFMMVIEYQGNIIPFFSKPVGTQHHPVMERALREYFGRDDENFRQHAHFHDVQLHLDPDHTTLQYLRFNNGKPGNTEEEAKRVVEAVLHEIPTGTFIEGEPLSVGWSRGSIKTADGKFLRGYEYVEGKLIPLISDRRTEF